MRRELFLLVGTLLLTLFLGGECFANEVGFIKNNGQIVNQHGAFNKEVLFIYSGPEYNVSFYADHFTYEIFSAVDREAVACERMELWFSSEVREPSISARSSHHLNNTYYKNGERFRNLISYDTILYANVWSGVSIQFFITEEKLKYDFIVEPWAAKAFEIEILGAEVTVGEEMINYKLQSEQIVEELPRVYIESGYERTDFQGLKLSVKNNVVRYKLPAVRNGTVVIDPIAYGLKYSTFYGGSNTDYVNSIGTLSDGSVIIGGYTLSTNNIATVGAYQTIIVDHDVFLAKFDSVGNRVWGTYFGGADYDRSYAIAIDQNDNIVLSGNTFSTSGIATVGTHQQVLQSVDDAFLAKFDNAGQLIWGTYYGGNGHDFIADVDVDSIGQIYITGHTNSTNLIVTVDAHNASLSGVEGAFMAVFDSSGSQIHGTYYGYGDGDEGWGIRSASDGSIYMTGYTSSSADIAFGAAHQPSYAGSTDGFLVKFSPSFVPVWGTYLGGTGADQAFGICLDDSMNIYVSGNTSSNNSVVLGSVFQDTMNSTDEAFLMKFDSAGTKLWGTYIGGFGADYIYAIEKSQSSIWLAGNSTSTSMLATNDATFPGSSGMYDNIILRFDLSGNRLWSTFTGGSQNDFGYDLAVLNDREVAIAGYSSSNNLNITTSAHQSTHGGLLYDGFWQKICEPLSLTLLSEGDTAYLCPGGSITVNSVNSFSDYMWSNGDTSASTSMNLPGKYWLVTEDSNGCPGRSDTLSVIAVSGLTPSILADTNMICANDSALLVIDTTFIAYIWSIGDTVGQVMVADSGTYWAQVLDSLGCWQNTDTIAIGLIPTADSIKVTGGTALCINGMVMLEADSSLLNLLWSNGDSTNLIVADTVGSYSFTAVDSNGCMVSSDSVSIVQISSPSPVVTLNISGEIAICDNESVEVQATSGYDQYAWSNGSDSAIITINTVGQYSVTVTDSSGCEGLSDTLIVVPNLVSAPTIESLTSDTIFCLKSNIFMMVNGTGYASYLWNSGGSSELAVYSFYQVGVESISVAVVDTNGCSSTDTLQILIEQCAGMEPLPELTQDFRAWYANGEIIVKSRKLLKEITIIDILGRTVLTYGNLRCTQINMQMELLNSGSYLVKILLDDNTEQVVKMLFIP